MSRPLNKISEILSVLLLLFFTDAFFIFIILKSVLKNIGKLLVNVKKAGTWNTAWTEVENFILTFRSTKQKANAVFHGPT